MILQGRVYLNIGYYICMGYSSNREAYSSYTLSYLGEDNAIEFP